MLPSPGAPLKLADGRLVYPNGDIVDPNAPKLIEVPSHQEARNLIVAARKKIADLPDVPKQMNAISAVLSYTLFGLDNTEIALATGLTENQVGTIKMQEAYASMHSAVVEGILAAETNSVRELFQQHSRAAANSMLSVLQTSKSEMTRVIVAKDFLDRAGHRPVDVVEHRHQMEGGLRIEFVTKKDAPVIDIELGDYDDH